MTPVRAWWIPVPQPLVCAAAAVVFAAAASADVQFNTGNLQGTNINFAADVHALTVSGEIGNTGLLVDFRGFGASPTFAPIELHAQHGVAFVEAQHVADAIYRFSITAPIGWGFTQMDWKLDAVPPSDGTLTFQAFDPWNNLLSVSGTNSFFFDHNGQNPFNAITGGGSTIGTLIITSTVPIADIKQVSVSTIMIPLPAAALSALPTLTAFGLFVSRRRR